MPKMRRGGESELQQPVAAPEDSFSPSVRTARPLLGNRPSAKIVALVALTVISVAFAVFGVVTGVRTARADDISATRSAAEDAASTAAETIFSYQYNRLSQHLSESEATMTPGFAKKFKSISPALKALAPQRKIQVKAVVRNAAAVECGDSCDANKATVLIFIDQARVADGVKKPTVFGNRIKVAMVRRNDRWLVSNIQAL